MTQFSSEFGAHFQLHFVSHLLRDADFLSQVKSEITPEAFSDEYLARIVRLALAFNDEHGGTPGDCIFQDLQDMRSKGLVSEDVASRLTLYLDKIFSMPMDNRKYLLDRFQEFSRFTKIEANLQDLINAAKLRDFQAANELLTSMIATPKVTDLGVEYTKDVTPRILRRFEEKGQRLWTLIPQMDSYVDGLRAGELGVFQSRMSSDGKTAALVLLARNFLYQGKKVLFLVLEGSVEGLEDRFDQCIGGLRKKELTGGVVDGAVENMDVDTEFIKQGIMARWQGGLERMFAGGGSIRMKKFPAYSTKVSDIANYLKQLEAVTGWVPDVIVCDYLDLCDPETKALRADLHGAGKEIYSNFIHLLEDIGIPGWTVMQSGRGAAESPLADQQHTGGSIAKVQLATVVISINRTEEDRKMNRVTLFIVKNRDGQARYKIDIPCDFETMRFWVPDVYQPESSNSQVSNT